MRYLSTRGGVKNISFKETVMMGLATDGGLMLPESIPTLDSDTISRLSSLSYADLAYEIISLYATDIPQDDLRALINKSYQTFDSVDVTPTRVLDDVTILELFHGPTLAFKDVALQFLGNMFEYLLKQSGEKMNIIGATSGDTGSAAIYGVRGKENINIFILHPHNRVSAVQRMQMTSVNDENVYNLAVEGTFDDCQEIVKTIFSDLDFKKSYALGAVNSINWARVLAQVVYYFKAYYDVAPKCDQTINFSVPTGNFGDIFAGYIAKRMGLPIETLILATNENDILTRFVNDGDYSLTGVHHTISPSMDIQLASNFERYLYYLKDGDTDAVTKCMEAFHSTGNLPITSAELQQTQSEIISVSANTKETLETIKEAFEKHQYVIDPHTAVGVFAARNSDIDRSKPVVCLSTAHPAKFPDAVKEATGSYPVKPNSVVALESLEQHFDICPADIETIKNYVKQHA